MSDTKTLLLHWDTSVGVGQNLERIRRENLFGKASRSRVEDILAIFRQRYLRERDVIKSLVKLVHNRLPGLALDRILYFHAARSDRLLHDVVTKILLPRKETGITDLPVDSLERVLKTWTQEGRTVTEWSDYTTLRVTRGLLSTLRDFGVLEGAANKRIAAMYLPIESFAYVAYYLKQHEPSGAKLIDHEDWKLFFLYHDAIERFLIEAQQRGLLEWHAAGSVTRLTFPVPSLEQFADVLAARAH